MSIKRVLFVAAAMAGACTDPELAPAVEEPATPTGGVAVVRTPEGIRRLPYADVGGRAIFEGDIDLGPVETFRSPLFGGAVHEDVGRRWPQGVVRFRFASGVTSVVRIAVRAQHTFLSRVTPLTFVDIGSAGNGNFITYRTEAATPDPDDNEANYSTHVGMQGGEQAIVFKISDRNENGTLVDDAPRTRTILHETLHAVGFWHEQSRPDSVDWIDVHRECIDASYQFQSQFDVKWEALGLGLYDFDSIMHYATGGFCRQPRPAGCTLRADTDGDGDTEPVLDSDGETICRTMTRATNGGRIVSRQTLSREDINMVWRMYPPRLDDGEAGDHAGQSLAVGDFDGDGYDDVAIGAPDEDVALATGGTVNGAGRVLVFRGTSRRLEPWFVLDRGPVAGAGDQFGFALSAADVDRDGDDDLLVGTPGDDLGTAVDAGTVDLFFGSDGGLGSPRRYTQATLGGTDDASDRFGAAVAAGPLANAAYELVVAIGAPGERNGTYRTGAVFVSARTLDGAQTTSNKLFDPDANSGSAFGSSLAVGNVDGLSVDLVIGAPHQFVRGAVHIYNAAYAGPSWPIAVPRQRILGSSGTDDFGAALAIGNLRHSATLDELVVGAPGTDDDAGEVYVYAFTTPPGGTGSMQLIQTIRAGGREDGDRYGAALALGNFDPSTDQLDLAVGSPGEDGGAGAISTFRGELGDATSQDFFRNSGFALQLDEAEDGFGTALAIGNLDGVGDNLSSDDFADDERKIPDLVVGIPGEGFDLPPYPPSPEGPAGAGAVGLFHGDGGGLDAAQLYFQNSATRD